MDKRTLSSNEALVTTLVGFGIGALVGGLVRLATGRQDGTGSFLAGLGGSMFGVDLVRRIYLGQSGTRLWHYMQRLERQLRQPRIRPAPGTSPAALARFFFSKAEYERVFSPILADMQLEYIEALAAGHRWKARWVLLRGYWSFLEAMPLQLVVRLAKQVVALWKVP